MLGAQFVKMAMPLSIGVAVLSYLVDTDALNSTNNVYYIDQAEANFDLTQFGHDNQQCQVWTNWQKTCARTQDGVQCAQDLNAEAMPSTAFCAVSRQAITHPRSDEIGYESAMRFCAVAQQLTIASDNPSRTVSACRRFMGGRPFSDPAHAGPFLNWCQRWRTSSGIRTCVRWNVPDWCKKAVIAGSDQEFIRNGADRGIGSLSLRISRPPDYAAINVLYCAEFEEIG